jgi:hypothetical protein
MIDRSAPVLVHTWLGPLYRDGDQELIGSIELDPAAGAEVVTSAGETLWGGYHGYFTDPDGYLWEVALGV